METRRHSDSGRWIYKKNVRPRFLTTCSQALAECSLKYEGKIIDSVREKNPRLYVAMDEAAFDSSMMPLRGYAAGGPGVFSFHGTGSWTST